MQLSNAVLKSNGPEESLSAKLLAKAGRVDLCVHGIVRCHAKGFRLEPVVSKARSAELHDHLSFGCLWPP